MLVLLWGVNLTMIASFWIDANKDQWTGTSLTRMLFPMASMDATYTMTNWKYSFTYMWSTRHQPFMQVKYGKIRSIYKFHNILSMGLESAKLIPVLFLVREPRVVLGEFGLIQGTNNWLHDVDLPRSDGWEHHILCWSCFFARISSWWLNQPIWKIFVKLGIFPKIRGEYQKIFETTT